MHLEATAALVDANISLTDLLGPLLPELRSTLLPGKAELEKLWSIAAMDCLALATELPTALPHLIDRVLAAAEPPAAADSPPATKPARTRSVISESAAALLGAAAASGLTSWRNRRHRHP